MEKRQWNWSFDQWLENSVWTKIPIFFLLGFMSAFLIMFILAIIF